MAKIATAKAIYSSEPSKSVKIKSAEKVVFTPDSDAVQNQQANVLKEQLQNRFKSNVSEVIHPTFKGIKEQMKILENKTTIPSVSYDAEYAKSVGKGTNTEKTLADKLYLSNAKTKKEKGEQLNVREIMALAKEDEELKKQGITLYETPQNSSQAYHNNKELGKINLQKYEIAIRSSEDFNDFYKKGYNIEKIPGVKFDKGLYKDIKNGEGIYKYLEPIEENVYYYLLGKGDNGKVREYILKKTSELESRKAADVADNNGVIENFAVAAGSGIVGTLMNMARAGASGSFTKGTIDGSNPLMNVLEPTYIEKLFQEISNNKEDRNFVYNLLLDATNSIAAQIPQMAFGAAGGYGAYIAAMANQSVGANTTEAIEQGYDGIRGVIYGVFDTALEASMEKILGGIGAKAFGSSTNPLLKKSLNLIDDVFSNKKVARTFAKGVSTFFSANAEGVEEFVQTLLEPVLRNALYGENNKITANTFLEAARAYLIGAISGLAMDVAYTGTSQKLEATKLDIMGEQLKQNLGVESIIKFAEAMENTSDLYYDVKGSFEANRDVDNSDVARLYNETAVKFENPSNETLTAISEKDVDNLIKAADEYTANKHTNAETLAAEPEISTENQPLQIEEQAQEITTPEGRSEEITEQIGFREPTDQPNKTVANFGGTDTSNAKHLDKSQQNEITEIGKKLGRKVIYEDFYNLDKFKSKKKIPDGYIDKDGNVHINFYAKRPVYFLFKHEITHYLKKSLASYNDFMNLVIDSNAFKDWLNKNGYSSINALKTEIMDTYNEVKGFDESKCYDEILANFVGEYLFGGENAINQNLIDALEPKQKKTFMDVIKGIIDYLKSKFQKNKPIQTEIDKIENEFIKVYKEAVGVRTDEAVDIEEQYAIYNHRGNLVEVDWDSDNFSSLSQQLQNHLEEVNNMQPVDSISFKATTGKKLYPQVFEAFKKFGFKVDVQNFGTIQLGEEEIRLAINGYINNDAEAAALLSIPRVLKRGKIISGHQNHKNRNYPTITFAAPVELNGKVGNVVVAVKVTGKTRYNAHRVLMPDGTEFVLDKEKDTESQLASVTDENEGQRFAKDSVSNNKLTQDKPIVKNNISKDSDFYSIPSTTSAESLLERYENGDITRQEYLDMLKGKKTLNPVEIANLKEEDANTTPPLQRKKGEAKGDKQSKFYGSIQGSELFGEEFKQEAASDEFIEKYKSITNKETLQTAAKELEEGGKEYVEKWWAIKPERANLIDTTVGFILMDRYQRAGKIEQAIAVAEKVREFGTASGQQVQIFSIIGRFDPDMMVAYAKKELSQAFETMVKGKTNKWIDKNKDKFQLTEEDIEFIRRRTLQAAMFEDGARQKAVALAEIQKTLQDKIPPESGDSIRALQRISMLLNPKTNERNIIGNAGMVGVFVASDVFGSGIDKIISQKTGVRTTGNFDIKSVSGIKKGLYESYDDFKRGIRTKQEELNRFDINASRSSKNFNENGGGIFGTKVLKKQLNDVAKVLNKIDNFTSFCLEAGDRPFFEMWYMNSLNTQLKLNNLEIPTPEMLEIAKEEALKRTWQDDNVYTRAVSNLKKNVNIIHIPGTSYGLGDFIFKFVKTPTNLAKAIVEFSPLGFAGATSNAIKLKNAIETNQFNAQLQKEFVRSTSNAITGTLVYALVAIGAALGVVKLSGDGDEDKDVSNYEKYIMGIPPYSIEFLGANMTYDWMQPFGSVLATVADFMQTKKEEPDLKTSAVIWEAIKAGGKTFTKQSFLQSMYDFFSQDDIVEGISSLVLSEPAAFIPQAFSQLASYLDKYRRTTYDATNAFQTSINKMIAKIPGLRTKLPKQVNVLGEDVKNTQYLNPWEAFASPWNTYPKSSNEIVGEIYDLYKKTGEDSVMPRTAPNYLTVKGNKVTFSPEEKAEFQRDMGRSSAEMLAILFDDSEYKKLSDNEKADVVSKIYEFAYAKSKSAIKYDYETLSAMAGEKKNGDPVLSESDYKKLPEKARQIIAQEYFLSKAEVRYIDNYNMLIQSFIKKVKE